jgi:RNA-directed DNA polymerase
MAGGCWKPTLTGVPQGGVASPLWSNSFLTPFDRRMTAEGFRLTRWADDLVVWCQTKEEAQRAVAIAKRVLREALGVTRPPQKTRLVHLSQGFDGLGDKVKQGTGVRLPAPRRQGRSNPRHLYAVPRETSVKRFQAHIRALTRRKAPRTWREVIARSHPVIRGWGHFSRQADVRRLFHRLDGWIAPRLSAFLAKRWRNPRWRRYPTRRRIGAFGLVRLTHLIPGLVHPGLPGGAAEASGVREHCMSRVSERTEAGPPSPTSSDSTLAIIETTPLDGREGPLLQLCLARR